MIFLLVVFVALIGLGIYGLLPVLERKRATVVKKEIGGETSWERLVKRMERSKFLRKSMHTTARALHKANDKSFDRNILYAAVVWLVLIACAVASVLLGMIFAKLWYLGVIYALVSLTLMYLCYHTLLTVLDNRFSQMMPTSYKYLTSRLITNGKILDSLKLAAGDSDPPVRKFLTSLHDIFKKTDASRVEELHALELLYDNRYATVLITLIESALNRGGNEVIADQLEELTEDIYFDTDNERDVTGAATTYIISSIAIIPASLQGLELMSTSSLGDSLGSFYVSPEGYVYKICILLGMLAYIGLLRYMEVKKVV